MTALLTPLLLAALTLPAATDDDGAPGPHVIVITLDTTRADHLGAYGHFQRASRWFDRWAEDGVLFERAYAPMAQTLPSHASLFTGLDPREHGATENHLAVPESVETLAEVLAARGWQTAAFVAARVLDAESGLGQGFEHYDESPRDGDNWKHADRRADAVTDAALAWLASRDDARPLFLWVHYFDPHEPYDAPAMFEGALPRSVTVTELISRFEQQRWSASRDANPALLEAYAERWLAYDDEILFMDHHLGRLMRWLTKTRLLDDAVVVVAGDHGEGLGEHDLMGHGLHVWEELLHVPLLIVAPGRELAGTRVAEPLPLRRAFDAVTHLALGDDAPGGDRKDPFESLRRRGRLPLEPIFVERPHYTEERFATRAASRAPADLTFGPLVGVIAGRLKLLRFPDGRHELYDLVSDPDELDDAAAARPDDVGRLAGLLERWLEEHPERPGEARPLSEERRRALEQLGYGR